jgi:hypothetical protein
VQIRSALKNAPLAGIIKCILKFEHDSQSFEQGYEKGFLSLDIISKPPKNTLEMIGADHDAPYELFNLPDSILKDYEIVDMVIQCIGGAFWHCFVKQNYILCSTSKIPTNNEDESIQKMSFSAPPNAESLIFGNGKKKDEMFNWIHYMTDKKQD